MIDRLSLVTGNEGKAREFTTLLGIEIVPVKEELIEIQSLDVMEVARRKAADAYSKLRRPVLVDDTGLHLKAWNGLPGALIRWFVDQVKIEGILNMAAGVSDRSATAIAALGFADANGTRVVSGTLHGTLATVQRGNGGFGWDSIFVPAGWDITFAEMSSEQKNAISHRRRATDALRQELGLPGT
ncbi:RdgB/HAM1 family non-canonical purine NTP pyrophosphatase [Streptomyces sp. 4N509B]|uniref:RdgB/HAM1 family non-canonical purine NTP pyrophosphatase n=1 Tax=Streptomyces sp. 4N509B TaxID=3457413 RepID=UPI003FD2F6CD